ncbi:hypothetical protein [Streptomyces specialis]|uniref:hypothetical protein n=1 Tax=Streptomyces specialis TaxID=498367 RepID=UPI00073F4811|nr:hypothetical protein [Streptomyces specialis]
MIPPQPDPGPFRTGPAGAPEVIGVGSPPVRLRLPVEFAAFCALHHGRYLRYCRLRLPGTAVAEAVVESALGELATRWAAALATSPAALAWHLLGRRVDAEARAAGQGDVLHRLLPAPQADAVLLRRRLRMSLAETAEVMGLAPRDVTWHLLLAERRLAPGLTGPA